MRASRTQDFFLGVALISFALVFVMGILFGLREASLLCLRGGEGIVCTYKEHSYLTGESSQRVLRYGTKEFLFVDCVVHSSKGGSSCGFGVAEEVNGKPRTYELFRPDGRNTVSQIKPFFEDSTNDEPRIEAREEAIGLFGIIALLLCALGSLVLSLYCFRDAFRPKGG